MGHFLLRRVTCSCAVATAACAPVSSRLPLTPSPHPCRCDSLDSYERPAEPQTLSRTQSPPSVHTHACRLPGGDQVAAGGILIEASMGVNLGPQLYVFNFTTAGIMVEGGHEVMVRQGLHHCGCMRPVLLCAQCPNLCQVARELMSVRACRGGGVATDCRSMRRGWGSGGGTTRTRCVPLCVVFVCAMWNKAHSEVRSA